MDDLNPDTEHSLQRQEKARAFKPKLAQLKEVLEAVVAFVDPHRLSTRLQGEKYHVTMAAILAHLDEASLLVRGNKGVARKAGLSDPLVRAYQLAASLRSNGESLPDERKRSEYKELRLLLASCNDATTALIAQIDGTIAEGALPHHVIHDLGMEKYTHFAQKMPGKDSPELTLLLDVPVVAMFNRHANEEELGARGFDVVQVAGYSIFRQVRILGVNADMCKQKKYDIEKVVDLALGKLGEKLNFEIGLMCPTPVSYKDSHWLFYWYGPTTDMDRLGGNLDSRLYVTHFQFPY